MRPNYFIFFWLLLYSPRPILVSIGGPGGPSSYHTLQTTILSIFPTHAQKEYCKVLERQGIYILSNLVLLFFENL